MSKNFKITIEGEVDDDNRAFRFGLEVDGDADMLTVIGALDLAKTRYTGDRVMEMQIQEMTEGHGQ